jgi:hypothetical protein
MQLPTQKLFLIVIISDKFVHQALYSYTHPAYVDYGGNLMPTFINN